MNKIISFLDQSNRYKHLVGDVDGRHNTSTKAKSSGKPVRKEKKLEMTAKSVGLTDAFRPKRSSTPGGTRRGEQANFLPEQAEILPRPHFSRARGY